MSFLLVPLFVLLAFFLPGYLFCRCLFRNPAAFSAGERWFLPIAISIGLTTWLALTLAEFGAFSLLNVAVLLLVVCAAVWFFARRHFCAWSLRAFKPDWIFLAILALAFVLFAHPAEYVVGNYDAGVYMNMGAAIARTGGIVLHDAQVPLLTDAARTQLLWDLPNPFLLYNAARMPGFFVADAAQGLVLPQFLHLYPVWLALWDALLGMQVGLYATPLIGIFSSIAFYFLVQALFDRRVARVAFFLLVITAPQFWFARYPVAEMLMQFLMLTGMYALVRFGKNNALGLGLPLWAGISFAEIFLARADAVLLLVPFVVYAGFLIVRRAWQRAHWVFLSGFGVLFVQAVVHELVFAPSYLYFQYTHVLRMRNLDKLLPDGLPSAQELATRVEYWLWLGGFLVAGLVVLLVVDLVLQRAYKQWGRGLAARLETRQQQIRLVGALVVVGAVLYMYLIAPAPVSPLAYVGGVTPATRFANFIKLGWYLSPFAIALAVIGGWFVVRRDLDRRNAFLFATAALYALFYLEELYSNPHFIYTSRHYVPLVIPLFILLAARGLDTLWNMRGQPVVRRTARVAAGALFGLWMIYTLYVWGIIDPCGRQQCFAGAAQDPPGPVVRLPFVTQVLAVGPLRIEPLDKALVGFTELGGAYAQIQGWANALDPNAVLVMIGNQRDEPALIAQPLRYFWGRDAFVVTANAPDGAQIADMIARWQAQGREVVLAYGTNGGRLIVPDVSLQPLTEMGLDVPQWVFAYDVMPRVSWRLNVNYALYRVVPKSDPAAYPFALDFGGADFPYLVRGFMERAPEAHARWIGALVANNKNFRDAKMVTGVVRIPVQTATSKNLILTLRARAPRENVRLQIKNNERVLGEVTLSQTIESYTLKLKNVNLNATADGYGLELASETTFDGEGRVLGAELEMLDIKRQE